MRPSDFAHWWHRETFRALLTKPRVARRGDPVATADAVRAALVERLGHRRADPPALHTLMQAAPARPFAARYAAMVLEASIRRQVAALAVHLQAASISDPDARPALGPAGQLPLRDVTSLVEPMLAELGAQWADAICATADSLPPVGMAVLATVDVDGDERRAARRRELAVVADRALAAEPDRPASVIRRDQDQLVAALVSHPDRIDATAEWLRPDHLARPTRAVFEALFALRQAAAPIDPVTVIWEIHRASRARGAGPDPRLLAERIEAGALLDIDQLTATVAHDILRRTATSAADGLRAAAANPGLTVGDVLDVAGWAADAFTSTARDIAGVAGTAQPGPSVGADRGATADPGRRSNGARWRRTRHLAPIPDGPDLSVQR